MTEHHAAPEHAAVHGDHDHGEEVIHAHDDSPEAIARETRRYLIVFGVLACLTGVTVAIAYQHFEPPVAIAAALIVASIKAFLVAGYFMHLLSERKLIYAVLAITVFFFAMLLWAPWNHHYDYFGR